MSVLAIDLKMNRRKWEEVEAYRYGYAFDLGRFDIDGSRNIDGDIVIWSFEDNYTQSNQQDRLLSGLIGSYKGLSVDDVLTTIDNFLDQPAF